MTLFSSDRRRLHLEGPVRTTKHLINDHRHSRDPGQAHGTNETATLTQLSSKPANHFNQGLLSVWGVTSETELSDLTANWTATGGKHESSHPVTGSTRLGQQQKFTRARKWKRDAVRPEKNPQVVETESIAPGYCLYVPENVEGGIDPKPTNGLHGQWKWIVIIMVPSL